ncbi:MAG: flagellar protein FlgN [Pseudomonadota bacterium]
MSALITKLKNVIESEIVLVQSLHDLLKTEYDMLTSRNLNDLPEITQKKEAQFKTLDQTGRQRIRLFAQCIPSENQLKTHIDEKVLENRLAHYDDQYSTQLLKNWRTLKSGLLRCKRQNEVNGRLINASRRNLDKLLIAVKGYNPHSQTYDKKGQAQYQKGSRTCMQA